MKRSWKVILRRVGLGLFGLWLLVVLWGLIFAWRKVPHYRPETAIELSQPLMTGAEYGAVINSHSRPYIVEIEASNGGAIVLYGAEHTRNPLDPQISDIQTRWEKLNPTVALVESDLGILFPGLMDPVETFEEPGAVHALAKEAGIPTYTWEPPLETRMQALLNQPFSKEQIALYTMLTPYFSNRRFGRPDDPEAYVAEAVNDRSEWPGIEGTITTVEELNQAWEKHFPNGPDWRDVSDEFGLPGYLGEIDGNLARDQHFVRVIIDLVNQGERVFAVAGSSHAVKLDQSLKAALSE